MYLNNKPTSKPVNTRKPMVTERKGPNTKEIATSTITAVPSGISAFFQNASQYCAAVSPCSPR